MKRIFIAFITLSVCVCTITAKPKDVKKACTLTPASDGRITFVGRTSVNGDNVSFDWSGVYARIDFNGKYVALKAGDTRKDYFNVWLDTPTDSKPDKVIRISSADTTIILFDKADFIAKYGKADRKGTQRHEVIIQKRTEGEQGTATFKSIITEGSVLQAAKLKKRQIEFIGDSYTCGYGTEAHSGEHFTPETENVNYSYAPIVSRYFDADYYIVAHSGMGIARNYNDNVKGYYMPDR
ncbi:MAG: hypothetical protein LKI42_05675, partial [Bacteroidales bacterium]|nr:hypothetical protein [Bacteroidales bacterium]